MNEAQAGIKIAERNINNLRYTDDTTLMEESEEELKSLLMKVKEVRLMTRTEESQSESILVLNNRIVYHILYDVFGEFC